MTGIAVDHQRFIRRYYSQAFPGSPGGAGYINGTGDMALGIIFRFSDADDEGVIGGVIIIEQQEEVFRLDILGFIISLSGPDNCFIGSRERLCWLRCIGGSFEFIVVS